MIYFCSTCCLGMSGEARGQILENSSLLLHVHLGGATTQFIRVATSALNLLSNHIGLN